MEKKQVLLKIKDSIFNGSLPGYEKNVEELLKLTEDEDACRELTQILFDRYNTFRADATAKLMEIVIRKRLSLAMINFPDNYLFRLCMIHGSMDLYECYIEEAIEPLLKTKSDDEIFGFYNDLYTVALKYNDAIFPKYVRSVKGMDFNGTFGSYEKDNSIALIHQEDFEIMDNVVEQFNSIVGRRDILIDLEKRCSGE